MDCDMRIINPEDTELLKRLFTLTVSAEFPEYSEKKKEFYTSGNYLDDIINLPIRIGAYVNDLLVGYLLSNNPLGGVCFIQWIAVLPDYQHQGIGKSLLKKVEEIAKDKGAHAVHLEADKRNISYYESLGYKTFGHTQHGYFNADEYFMEKLIQEPKEENYLR